MKLAKVHTSWNYADILTKPLDRRRFVMLRDALMNVAAQVGGNGEADTSSPDRRRKPAETST